MLTTERLFLRAVERRDQARLLELQIDPVARRYLGGGRDQSAAEAAVNRALANPSRSLVAVEHVSGDVVGTVEFSEDRGQLEVSYVFHPAYWGRGYAGEALRAALEWGLTEWGVDCVIAVTQEANLPSRRLLTRLGFAEATRFVEWGDLQVLYRMHN